MSVLWFKPRVWLNRFCPRLYALSTHKGDKKADKVTLCSDVVLQCSLGILKREFVGICVLSQKGRKNDCPVAMRLHLKGCGSFSASI